MQEKEEEIALERLPSERSQVILDYKKERSRDEIREILFAHFAEGRTDSARLVEMLSNPKANPRILNINPVVVGAHLGSYKRWKDKRNKKQGELDPEDLEQRMRAFEARLDQKIQNLEANIQRPSSTPETQFKTIGKEEEPEAEEKPTATPPELGSSEELRERKRNLEEMQDQLRIKKEELEVRREELKIGQQSSKILSDLVETEKKLKRSRARIEKFRELLSQKELPEEDCEIPEIEGDPLIMDVMRVLKRCEVVMPDSVRNIINKATIASKSREAIKKILEDMD